MSRRGFRSLTDPSAREEGTMALAILVIVVTGLLTLAMLPFLLNHIRSTQSGSNQAAALASAQSGVNVALAQVREAGTALGSLPCGTLESPSNNTVSISYADTRSAPVSCTKIGGTNTTPATATIVSTGRSGGTQQTVTVTYTFYRRYNNNPGGEIHVQSGVSDLCFDAGSNPAVGSGVTLQACASTPSQLFFYSQNMTLSLPATVTAQNSYGLCLTIAQHVSGSAVTLQQCGPVISAEGEFQYRSDNQFHSTATSGVASESNCLLPKVGVSPGSQIALQVCGGTGSPTIAPDPAVGTGAAARTSASGVKSLQQIVSYGSYNTCLSAAGGPITTATCAQPYQFDLSDVPETERWDMPPTPTTPTFLAGPIQISTGNCLAAPPLTIAACDSNDSSQQWKIYGPDSSGALDYRIVDSSSKCLQLSNVGVSLDTCVGGLSPAANNQRWNADPSLGTGVGVTKTVIN